MAVFFADIVVASLVWLHHRATERRLDGSPPSRLEARTADEAAGHREQAVDHLQRQRRQSARRRPIENARVVLEIELRKVAGALDRTWARLPIPDVTARMGADGRVGDETIDGSLAGLATETIRVQANQQHLIQSRVVTDYSGRRVHRKGDERRLAVRDVLQLYGLPFALAAREDQAVVWLRPHPSKLVLSGDEVGHRQTQANGRRQLEDGPTRDPGVRRISS